MLIKRNGQERDLSTRFVCLVREDSRVSEYKIDCCPSCEEWNAFLEEHDRDNLQQSFAFGEALKALYPNTKIVRLLAKKYEKPVGLVQGFYNQGRVLGGTIFVEGHHGTGPVIAEGENKNQVFRELISALEKYAVKNRVPSGSIVHQSEMGEVLRNMGYKLFCRHNSYKINLHNGVDKVWREIDHNKRRNIRKASKAGVEVNLSTSIENLALFHQMLQLSSERVGFEIRPFKYYVEILKIFGKIEKARIFTAYLRDQPVAGLFVVNAGNTAHALAAGSLPEAWKARPNDLIHWKAIEQACKEGLSAYNMGAVPDPPGGSLWRWKSEWRGQLEKMPTSNKTFMPKLEQLVIAPYGKMKKRLAERTRIPF